jgi:hypothetical protein
MDKLKEQKQKEQQCIMLCTPNKDIRKEIKFCLQKHEFTKECKYIEQSTLYQNAHRTFLKCMK